MYTQKWKIADNMLMKTFNGGKGSTALNYNARGHIYWMFFRSLFKYEVIMFWVAFWILNSYLLALFSRVKFRTARKNYLTSRIMKPLEILRTSFRNSSTLDPFTHSKQGHEPFRVGLDKLMTWLKGFQDVLRNIE